MRSTSASAVSSAERRRRPAGGRAPRGRRRAAHVEAVRGACSRSCHEGASRLMFATVSMPSNTRSTRSSAAGAAERRGVEPRRAAHPGQPLLAQVDVRVGMSPASRRSVCTVPGTVAATSTPSRPAGTGPDVARTRQPVTVVLVRMGPPSTVGSVSREHRAEVVETDVCPETETPSGVQPGASRPERRRATASAGLTKDAVTSPPAGTSATESVTERARSRSARPTSAGSVSRHVGLAGEADEEREAVAEVADQQPRRAVVDRRPVVERDTRVPTALGGLVRGACRRTRPAAVGRGGSRGRPGVSARCSGVSASKVATRASS